MKDNIKVINKLDQIKEKENDFAYFFNESENL
jgi:hypothetical protein